MPNASATELPATPHTLRQLLSLIDLTSLNDQDTPATISALCQKAIQPSAHVAAVCVYPQFVPLVVTQLMGMPVNIATVANFPEGTASITAVVESILKSIRAGAREIDVVFPYQLYLSGDKSTAADFIRVCRTACGDFTMKVILETGAFTDNQVLYAAATAAVAAGADFLKTSTGKIAIGATPEAARVLLTVIKELQPVTPRLLGFKASGGVRTIEQASSYVAIARQIMGTDWVRPDTFRLGASQLLDSLLAAL